MKIEIEVKNQEVEFEKVPIGDLFAHPAYSYSDRDVYMAVDEHCIGDDKINAVRLSDGYLYDFNDNDDVRLISNAKLIIR